MSFKELTKYRMQFLKVLSEKEFSLDFYIFAMEAVQDAQYISEEDAENVAKLIVDCVNAGDGEDEIIEKARLKVDYAKYVFGVKKAITLFAIPAVYFGSSRISKNLFCAFSIMDTAVSIYSFCSAVFFFTLVV